MKHQNVVIFFHSMDFKTGIEGPQSGFQLNGPPDSRARPLKEAQRVAVFERTLTRPRKR